MVKCAIKSCGLRKDNYNHGLTLHRLPRNDTEKKKWIDVIGADNINLNIKNTFICSVHFEESSFNRTLDVIRLRDNSVPSLYLQSAAPVQECLLPELQDPGHNATQAAGQQRSCQQIKVTSGPSPKLNEKKLCSVVVSSVGVKSPAHHISDLDPLGEHPVPLGAALDPLGEGNVTQEPPGGKLARVKDDTYLTHMQASKLSALSTRCKALNRKLKRSRELLRRRERKLAALRTDVHTLRDILTRHQQAGGQGAPAIQILSSKDGVVKKQCSGQVLYIERGVTRLNSPGSHTLDLPDEPVFTVTASTDIRAKSPDGHRTSDIRQKPPSGVIRTSVIRNTLSDIRPAKSPEFREVSSVGGVPSLELGQELFMDVRRRSDILPDALVIQLDGKRGCVLPTLVRLQHATHMETG